MNEQSTAPAQHPKDWCMGMDFFFFFCRGSFLQEPSFPSAPSPHKTTHDLYGQFLIGQFYKPVKSVFPR